MLLVALLGCHNPAAPPSGLPSPQGGHQWADEDTANPDDNDTAGNDTAEPTTSLWYSDADGDDYGDPNDSIEGVDAPAGTVADSSDCDDGDPEVHPGADEICNEVDDDCDGETDEGVTPTWYADTDGDGWGNSEAPSGACEQPAGHVADDTDCDDDTPEVFPGADEVCDDGVDSDCSGIDLRCLLTGSTTLAMAEATYFGTSEGDLAGANMTCGGDTDGDDGLELLIGETQRRSADALPGGAWLVTEPTSGSIELDAHAVGLWGEDDRTGALAFLDDLDGDGYEEVALASTYELAIFNGPVTTDLVISDASAVITSTYGGTEPNQSITPLDSAYFAAGGVGNHLMGGDWGEDVGAIYVFEGPLSGDVSTDDAVATLTPSMNHEFGQFSFDMCSGDFDGDGSKDLAVGAPSIQAESYDEFMSHGLVYLVHGPFSGDYLVADPYGELVNADARIRGSTEADGLGTAVSCGGDANGDGLDDVLAAATYAAYDDINPGQALLFSGTLSGDYEADEADAVLTGDVDEVYLVGVDVTLNTDLDGDGNHELITSDYTDSDGSTYVFYGPATGTLDVTDADVHFVGEAEGDSPINLAGCPDLDGDGFGELLIGATGVDTYGTSSGAAYLVFGGGG